MVSNLLNLWNMCMCAYIHMCLSIYITSPCYWQKHWNLQLSRKNSTYFFIYNYYWVCNLCHATITNHIFKCYYKAWEKCKGKIVGYKLYRKKLVKNKLITHIHTWKRERGRNISGSYYFWLVRIYFLFLAFFPYFALMNTYYFNNQKKGYLKN